MYNQVSSKCGFTIKVKTWQNNDHDDNKIEIKELIDNVWIANYQKDVEVKDSIVDKFSNPLNNRNWYYNSIVPENISKL